MYGDGLTPRTPTVPASTSPTATTPVLRTVPGVALTSDVAPQPASSSCSPRNCLYLNILMTGKGMTYPAEDYEV